MSTFCSAPTSAQSSTKRPWKIWPNVPAPCGKRYEQLLLIRQRRITSSMRANYISLPRSDKHKHRSESQNFRWPCNRLLSLHSQRRLRSRWIFSCQSLCLKMLQDQLDMQEIGVLCFSTGTFLNSTSPTFLCRTACQDLTFASHSFTPGKAQLISNMEMQASYPVPPTT